MGFYDPLSLGLKQHPALVPPIMAVCGVECVTNPLGKVVRLLNLS